jgi:hypothetical protein
MKMLSVLFTIGLLLGYNALAGHLRRAKALPFRPPQNSSIHLQQIQH